MNDRIDSLEKLEKLYAKPAASSLGKELSSLNAQYRQLIAASPFVVVGSIGPSGMDCSPRGDAPGFVKVINDTQIAIPDRRGNNRLDTLRNIVANPQLALLFMIPGINETLRINGRAYLTVNEELLDSFEVNGKAPVTAIMVDIDTVFFQCARALKRSDFWNPSNHVPRSSLPSTGSLIKSAIADFDSDHYDAALPERQAKTLW